jgi:hypothetical protein
MSPKFDSVVVNGIVVTAADAVLVDPSPLQLSNLIVDIPCQTMLHRHQRWQDPYPISSILQRRDRRRADH